MKAKQKLLVLVNILLALIKVSIIYNISSFKIEWTLKNETVRWVNVYNITKLLVQFEKLFKREGGGEMYQLLLTFCRFGKLLNEKKTLNMILWHEI